MTLLWLLVWALNGTPQPTVDPINVWTVFLALAILSDLSGARRAL